MVGAARVGAVVLAMVMGGCAARTAPPAPGPATPAASAAAPAAVPAAARTYENLDATLWMQTAIEYHASASQAYRLATAQLDRALADPTVTAAIEQQGQNVSGLPPAIILDADETVLDNTPYQARLLTAGGTYDDATWKVWVNERKAGAVPGAVAFTQYARAKGVTVFFITNRNADLEPATRDDMTRLGFPLDATRDTLLMRRERPEWESSEKAARRSVVARDFRILMLLGDDLGDFLPNARGTIDERQARVAAYDGWWGSRWIMIPNPTYGSWEMATRAGAASPAAADQLKQKLSRLRP
jgi:5'-nucleotidase (lipoprotein e(P4) family)